MDNDDGDDEGDAPKGGRERRERGEREEREGGNNDAHTITLVLILHTHVFPGGAGCTMLYTGSDPIPSSI